MSFVFGRHFERRSIARVVFTCLALAPLANASADEPAPASAAFADEPPAEILAEAREKFRTGLEAETAGNWEGALRVFKQVALVRSTPQVRFHIGVCEEKIGAYVEALGSFRLALFEARKAKTPDVEEAATAALAELEPKMPKLTISRGAGAASATVLLDERALGATSIGAVLAVNPGPHVVKASAPDHKPVTIEFSIADRENKVVVLVLPDAPPTADAFGDAPSAAADTVQKKSPMKTIGFAIGGVGIASLGASAIFLAARGSAISDLDSACGADGQHCPADLSSTYDQGQTFSTLTTVTFIGGLACVGAGAVLILTAPRAKSPTSARSIWVAPSVLGGTVGGQF